MLRKISWPVIIVAAAFLLYFGFGTALTLTSPKIGLYTRNVAGTRVVERIVPHSPAEMSGIQPGDRIVRIDGQNVIGPDWIAVQMNITAARPSIFDIDRGGQRISLAFTPQRNPWSDLSRHDRVQFVISSSGALIMLGCACLVALSRPKNGPALVGALLLASLSILNATPPTGFAAAWRALPVLVGAMMWVPTLAEAVSPALVFTFCATFPRQVSRSLWAWVLIWTAELPVLFLFARFMYFTVYDPAHALGTLTPRLITMIITIGILYVASGVVTMALNYRKLDLKERRQVRVLVFGTVAAMVASPLAMIASSMPFQTIRLVAESLPFAAFIHIIIYWVFPLSFVYSVLRHRSLID